MTRQRKPPTLETLAAPRTPSGQAFPAVSMSTPRLEDTGGIPIVLTWRTIAKIVGPSLAVVLLGASIVLYYHWQAVSHLSNTVVHLLPGERSALVTRSEVERAHGQLVDRIEVSAVKARLEQAERIQAATKEIKTAQAREVRRVLRQIRETP